MKNTTSLTNNFDAFKTEIKSHAQVADASYSSFYPSTILQGSWTLKSPKHDQFYTFDVYETDADHLNTLGLRLVQGKFFDERNSNSIVVNETAANLLNISLRNEKEYLIAASDWKFEVVGVIEDHNYKSLHEEIQPLILRQFDNRSRSYLMIRFKGGSPEKELALVKNAWSKFSPAPFEYSFLDQDLMVQYSSERKLGHIVGIFTTFAIAIACTGLLGLLAFIANQRKKEIGIRKILGATIGRLVQLVSYDFFKMLVIALLIGIPLSWVLVNRWLESFPYRIHFDLAITFAASLIVLGITITTILIQSLAAARANPVESLKSE